MGTLQALFLWMYCLPLATKYCFQGKDEDDKEGDSIFTCIIIFFLFYKNNFVCLVKIKFREHSVLFCSPVCRHCLLNLGFRI
jgi:hypothetical protein